MRFLIVDHVYGAFADWVYGSTPGLETKSYADQKQRLDKELFGETQFEVAALRAQGHEAYDHIANVRPLLEAWFRENGLGFPGRKLGVRWRRGYVPWPTRRDNRWIGEALLARVRHLKPDVVHIQAMDLLPPWVIAALTAESLRTNRISGGDGIGRRAAIRSDVRDADRPSRRTRQSAVGDAHREQGWWDQRLRSLARPPSGDQSVSAAERSATVRMRL